MTRSRVLVVILLEFLAVLGLVRSDTIPVPQIDCYAMTEAVCEYYCKEVVPEDSHLSFNKTGRELVEFGCQSFSDTEILVIGNSIFICYGCLAQNLKGAQSSPEIHYWSNTAISLGTTRGFRCLTDEELDEERTTSTRRSATTDDYFPSTTGLAGTFGLPLTTTPTITDPTTSATPSPSTTRILEDGGQSGSRRRIRGEASGLLGAYMVAGAIWVAVLDHIN
ncbi:hypothetical protein IAT38_002717 [Cryptococcus sp. DSM 104549]